MILILSEDIDITANKVVDWLYYFNVPFVKVNENNGLDAIESVVINSNGIDIDFIFDGKHYNLSDFNVVWNRRGYFRISSPQIMHLNYSNDVKYEILSHLKREKQTLLDFIYFNLYKNKNTINDPRKYSLNKLIVLQYAIEVGLNVPNTCISNKSNIIKHSGISDNAITKNIQDIIRFINGDIAFGHKVENIDLKNLKSGSNFFYSLFQSNIKKKFEVRAFVFFDKIYSVALFTQNNNSSLTDSRNVDLDDRPNRVVPYLLPKETRNKIFNLMRLLKLESGSVDLIISPNKEIYFLEVNPVGQLDYVSSIANYNIEKEIALFLKYKNENT